MTNEDFKKEVSLKENDIFIANGEKYQIKNGKIIHLKDEEKDNFSLIFELKPNMKFKEDAFNKNPYYQLKQIKDNIYQLDILPIIKELFEDKDLEKVPSCFSGISYDAKGSSGKEFSKIMLSSSDLVDWTNKMAETFNGIFTNQRQLDAVNKMTKRLLESPFDKFYNDVWC